VASQIVSTKPGKQAWVEIRRESSAKDGWEFRVQEGTISEALADSIRDGTKVDRKGNFRCILTGSPITSEYIRRQAQEGHLGIRLMAVVAAGHRRRHYLSPEPEQEAIAVAASPSWRPEGEMYAKALGFRVPNYGLREWSQLFTERQLKGITSLCDLIQEVREKVISDANHAGLQSDTGLADGGRGAVAYADAISTYLALIVGRVAQTQNTLCRWFPQGEKAQPSFDRQTVNMVWDFAEGNLLGESTGSISAAVKYHTMALEKWGGRTPAKIWAARADNGITEGGVIICTDPPYYDNIGYGDLYDFFYIWLRRTLRDVWPDLFRRIITSKEHELVATPGRHGGKTQAEIYFMSGMQRALQNLNRTSRNDYPAVIFYAFKQSELKKDGLSAPGWSSFLQAVYNAGFIIDGTWPVRTEHSSRMTGLGKNALSSSIVLVCSKRGDLAAVTTRREFIARLKREMPDALQKIKEAGVGPVDIAQSALGPGMGIFTSYARVLEPDDSEMTVRTAIALINEVREEILGEEDAHYDPATRFCIDWFQTFGMEAGKAGDAIGMANAYNLGLGDLEQAGVFHAKEGVARLLKRSEMRTDWRPSTGRQLTHWECAQHLICALEAEDGGTAVAAGLIAEMSPEDAEAARALAYRLYDICEKKGWAQEAKVYNLLAEEFPHLEQAALDQQAAAGPREPQFDFGEARQ